MNGATDDGRKRTVSRLRFDVWNEVPLVPQLTGMSCWAAAAAMIVGWRDRVSVLPGEVASGAGHWGAYDEGLHPSDVEALASTWRLELEPARRWDVLTLRARLEEVGPLWLGEASPGLHSIVITGIFGDGSADGTHVRVNDPWPVGRGERYLLTFRSLMQNLRAASALVGGAGQILHSGGRGQGASGSEFEQQHTRTSSSESPSSKAPFAVQSATSAMSREWRHEGVGSYGQVAAAAGQRFMLSSSLPRDPLASHAGRGENLFLCWTHIPADAAALDVVVHLHGYTPRAADRAMLEERVRIAGLDLSRRSSPTLGIIARGRQITAAEIAATPGVNRERYTFPGLLAGNGQGLEALVAQALEWLAREVLGRGSSAMAVRRFILSAHSGGGAPLNALLRHAELRRVCDPHEAHVFDALYSQVDGLSAWATRRLRRHLAGAAGDAGALRIVHGAGTLTGSRAVMAELRPLLAGALPSIARFYRAQATTVGHNDIPAFAGVRLLADAAAELPSKPPASVRTQGLARAEASSIAAPAGDSLSEESGERYGIPLGLFRYYAPSKSGAAARSMPPPAAAGAVAPESHASPNSARPVRRRRGS